MSNEAEQIIEWVERQWPDGPAFECAQLLRETLLKLEEYRKADDAGLEREVALLEKVKDLESRLGAARDLLHEAVGRLGPDLGGRVLGFLMGAVKSREYEALEDCVMQPGETFEQFADRCVAEGKMRPVVETGLTAADRALADEYDRANWPSDVERQRQFDCPGSPLKMSKPNPSE